MNEPQVYRPARWNYIPAVLLMTSFLLGMINDFVPSGDESGGIDWERHCICALGVLIYTALAFRIRVIISDDGVQVRQLWRTTNVHWQDIGSVMAFSGNQVVLRMASGRMVIIPVDVHKNRLQIMQDLRQHLDVERTLKAPPGLSLVLLNIGKFGGLAVFVVGLALTAAVAAYWAGIVVPMVGAAVGLSYGLMMARTAKTKTPIDTTLLDVLGIICIVLVPVVFFIYAVLTSEQFPVGVTVLAAYSAGLAGLGLVAITCRQAFSDLLDQAATPWTDPDDAGRNEAPASETP